MRSSEPWKPASLSKMIESRKSEGQDSMVCMHTTKIKSCMINKKCKM